MYLKFLAIPKENIGHKVTGEINFLKETFGELGCLMKQYEKKLDRPPVEDQQLIQAFLAGDQLAFDELVRKHQEPVFNLCFRMLENYDDAVDLAQEIFIKVYRNLNSFRFQSTFTTWLYRITVNACKNKLVSAEYRYRGRNLELDRPIMTAENSVTVELPDESYAPDHLYEKKTVLESIHKAIGALPPDQKVMVVLCDIEGKTYEEIVQITGHKLGTVKSKLARARHELRRKLEGVI